MFDGGNAFTIYDWTFTTPIVLDVPPLLPSTRGPARSHLRHYSNRPRGRSVLKESGAYRTTDVPTGDELEAADKYWIGGYLHQVDEVEAASLLAAGFTVVDNAIDGGNAATVHTIANDGGDS